MNILHTLRGFRARRASRLMEKALGSPPDRYAVFWQSAWIPFFGFVCLAGSAALVSVLTPVASDLIWTAWSFFRFEEVFRFQFPARGFFDQTIAVGVAGLFVLYAGPALLRQIRSLRSCVLIRKSDGALHLVEGGIWRRRVTVLLPADIAGSAVRENAIFRWINTADLVIDTRGGKEITLRGLFQARTAYQMIENARSED